MERVAVVVAVLLSLLITWASGFILIPWLKKIKFGQTINKIGPSWHKAKQGIPTMGGFMFVLGSSIAVLCAYPILAVALARQQAKGDLGLLLLAMFTAAAFGAVGFIDDYLKVVHKQNLGLKASGKIIMQTVIIAGFLVTLHFMGRLSTFINLPFVGSINLGIFFYPLSYLFILYMVNAVNLTDGLDGLASSVTFWVMCGYVFLLTLASRLELSVWAGALAGGCAGFLLWNFYPAKVFMGDTGSMFLGGAVSVLAYCMGSPEILFFFGLLYILEALSVVIQVTYFKITKGKRLFKMTPIHHHFELIGWKEKKIVVVFSLFSLLFVVLGCLYSYFV